MKFAGIALSAVVVVVGLLPAGTRAFPLTPYAPRVVIPILKDDRSQDAYGGYSFSYGTGNGIYRDEVGRQNYGQVTQGGWSYTSPEGVPVKITFVADQGGYQPSGNVLPVAPALPYSRTQVY
ncbi:flexible cuticle protein 12-like [Penaeus vannamei]|uniref:flexible cuticle protein 12-like n=1 Tax=Penaeus vannamei TaxID=6689 RepID=UPI00387F66E9